MRDESGEPIKWFGTSTDIEDRKKAEIALLNKQKLESVGLLAGGIAHDFNNLLVGIVGGASFASEALPASHPLQGTLQGIATAGERAAHLTRQMLAYAGKGRFFIEQIDMGELVRSTCDLIRASIPKHVQMTITQRGDLPPVEADSSQMQQIVMNLVLNAAEATDQTKGGTVAVTTELMLLNASSIASIEFVSGTLSPGPYIVFEVRDNGGGMDPETKSKIFDPFFTTKFTGRGLGLSAVEGILRTHKGAIALKSQSGKGSTFQVFLPASQKAKSAAAVEQEGSSTGAGTILIVDDEEIVRSTAKASLERAGFDVLVAESGEKAIEILIGTATKISLIVLDMGMPDMSGKEVLQQIRTLGIEVPVLICSGYSEAEVVREFASLDIAGFAQKPFMSRQIVAKVSAVVPAVGTRLANNG
jgi:two-component system CheB/CheR fusion protein